MTIINSFNGGYSFLSNYYAAPVVVDGICYQNSEAAYQAGKAAPAKRRLFSNLTPDQAKRLGKSVRIQKSWDIKRADHMRRVVHAKFTQNPALAIMLLGTGSSELEEGNSWHDNYFGNCYCPACQNIKGKNMLGKILMEERAWLREVTDEYTGKV